MVEPDPHSNNVFQGTERKYKFTPTTCKDDKNLQLQLFYYYYCQGATILLLFLTYLRVLRSGVSLTQIKSDLMYPLASSTQAQDFLQSGSPGIEFSNNKIKIRKENPCKKRDTLILKSCTGALLGLSSVTGALFSLFKLLPAIYTNACH